LRRNTTAFDIEESAGGTKRHGRKPREEQESRVGCVKDRLATLSTAGRVFCRMVLSEAIKDRTNVRLAAILLLVTTLSTKAQLVVDGKDINADTTIQYVQLSFFFDSKKLLPVYVIDVGKQITSDEDLKPTKIFMGDEEVTNQMTPMYVLNRLFEAGWEYVGDGMFMRAPILENTQAYTLRRRSN
jgi:hypothetical protein